MASGAVRMGRRPSFAVSPAQASDSWQASLDEARTRSLVILVVMLLVLCWALFALQQVEPAYGGLRWVIGTTVVGCGGTLLLLRWNYTVAAAAWLVIAMLAASTAAIWTIGTIITFWSPALVVSSAGMLLRPRFAVSVGFVAAAVLLDRTQSAEATVRIVAWSGLVLIWASLLLTWLQLQPLEGALAWASHGQAEAGARAREAERHRGELARLVKSLTETHERLERVTAQLANAQEAAEQAYAVKARFAAYISHELRTPLNLIIGFSEMMAMAPHTYGGEILPPAYRGDVDAIYHSAKHLSTLINDVLDLSQIDAHRMALDRDDVALREIVAEAFSAVGATYADRGLWLRAEISDDVPLLYLDRTRIRQVLIGLLSNALTYTQAGGVTVHAAIVRSDVVVTVTDTGIGVPAEALPTLFEDFHQAGYRGTDNEGSGLGLAIARRFVALHGGWMRAESSLDEGSTFSFGLPVRRDAANEPYQAADWLPTQALPAVLTTLPVLAVRSGDPWLIRTLQRYLDGYRVSVVDDDRSEEVQQRLEGVAALIVPVRSNDNHSDALAPPDARAMGAPIIYCSRRGGPPTVGNLSVADYIDKPVARERLAQALALHRSGKGRRTILIVDDDHHMLRLLGRQVRSISRDYRVLKAHGGAEALDLMRRHAPALVLLDLLMPGVDGNAVLERMRQDETLRDVPVVVVTGTGREDDSAAVEAFTVAQPDGFSAGEFVRCLQAALDNLNPRRPTRPA